MTKGEQKMTKGLSSETLVPDSPVGRRLNRNEARNLVGVVLGERGLNRKGFCEKVAEKCYPHSTDDREKRFNSLYRQFHFVEKQHRPLSAKAAKEYAQTLGITISQMCEEIRTGRPTELSLGPVSALQTPETPVEDRTGTHHDFRYRAWRPTVNESIRISKLLAKRYGCESSLFETPDTILPIVLLWRPKDFRGRVDPDSILVKPLSDKPHSFVPDPYEVNAITQLRKFQPQPVYRMTSITLRDGKVPQLCAGVGTFMDHTLSQMTLRCELAKAVIEGRNISDPATLPLRKKCEERKAADSLTSATARCAGMAIVSFFVLQENGELRGLLMKRSDTKVFQHPSKWHVIPSAMFESESESDVEGCFSITANVIREFREEILGETDAKEPNYATAGQAKYAGSAPRLRKLFETRKAALSLLGVVIDLETLVPEICTILVMEAEDFEKFTGSHNDESERLKWLKPLTKNSAADLFSKVGTAIVPSGGVCIEWGIQWLVANKYL